MIRDTIRTVNQIGLLFFLCSKLERKESDDNTRYFVPEFNSSEEDLHSIMYDLLKYNNKTIKLIYENQLAIAFFDKFPINEGHMLIITKKHYPTF